MSRPLHPGELARVMQLIVDAVRRGELQVEPCVAARLEDKAAALTALANRHR